MVVELVLLVAIAVSVFAFVLAPLLRPEVESRAAAEPEAEGSEQQRNELPTDSQPVHESS